MYCLAGSLYDLEKNFDYSGEISSILYFDRLLLMKVCNISAKKYRRVTSHATKVDAKFEEKPICCFKHDKNLVNFNPSTQKSPKFALS